MTHLIEAASSMRWSKTLWFNAAVAGLATLELNFGLLEPMLGTRWYGVAFVAICVINVVLRYVREHAAVAQTHSGE